MKNLKKILYLFLIIFTLSFSMDGDKSKVILDKRQDVAELKIGVTKVISKELSLEFHAESKKIYGEIDIDDNDLVFVSETLDEMPSVSTTNGRKAINNIKKYLTKNIKKSPKFEYQIVEEKVELDKPEVKKYLLIDCKEQLSGVYIYVVEKGSYKVKEVYRGVFKQLLNNARAIVTDYGTIHFSSQHPITSKISKVTYNGSNILINGKIENSVAIENGKFPERYKGDLPNPSYKKGYRIKVKNGLKEYMFPKDSYYYFEDDNISHTGSPNKEINKEVELYGTLTDGTIEKESVIGKLRIMSDKDDYLKFEIYLNYLNIDIENEITIDYGSSSLFGGFEPKYSNKFKIKIDNKGMNLLPANTKGILTVSKGEELYNTVTRITGITGEEGKDGKKVESNNPKAEIEIAGDYLETLDADVIGGGQNLLKFTVKTRNGLKAAETKIVTVDDGNGNVLDTYDNTFNLYDSFGNRAGNLNIGKRNASDKYYTLEISNFPEMTEMINTDIILEYIVRPVGEKSDLNDRIVKKDLVTLYIKPRKENIPKGTNGKLVLYTIENLRNNDFYIENGNLKTKPSDNSGNYEPYDLNKCRYLNIPMRLKNNQKGTDTWIYWGEETRILLEGPNVEEGKILHFSDDYGKFGNTEEEKEKIRKEGTFVTYRGNNELGTSGWIRLEDTNGKDLKKGFIQFNMKEGMESLTIGFRGSVTGHNPAGSGSFELNPESSVDSVYRIKYQTKLKNKDEHGTITDVWHTIKEDTIEIIITSTAIGKEKTIELSNPLVYYDYKSSSAISNIVHKKRAHLSGREAITLTSGGAVFNKNTDLDGKKWIEIKNEDVLDYSESFNNKHRVTIRKGSSEVRKMTDENGRTSSSTFLGDTGGITSNTRDGRENEVMFSYDGANKYLNFGLSKYNFKGTTISDVLIINDGIVDNDGGDTTDKTVSRETFIIKIPKFEGIHYVNPNYDIKPRQDYIKNHVFDDEVGTGAIDINYGTVGFRDLDTRITNESGGEGIDIKVYKNVILKSKSNPNYVIKGVKLYFEGENPDGDISYFKGTNEKATSKLLKLHIPAQETLIPKEQFKILRADTNGYPLEVGVTVNGNTEEYYTPIDNELKTNGEEGKNLYLNLSRKRFIETTIEFENPALGVDKEGNPTKEINWIKLNKTDYPGGKLSNSINNSDLWGRVRGVVVDIPPTKEIKNIKMQVFQEDVQGKEKLIEDNLTGKKVSFNFSEKRNFVMRHNKGDNYIEFSLDNGYDEVKDKTKEIVFYIRYLDLDNKDGNNNPKFLFDQRYTIKFKDKKDYLADTTLVIKNPAMVSGDSGKGRIILKGHGEINGEENNKTFDKIKWYEVQNTVNYPKNVKSYILKNIDNGSEYDKKYYSLSTEGHLEIGLPNDKKDFVNHFLLSDYKEGKDIERSFSLTVNDNGVEKNYRINILVEKFDPKYYGKVYLKEEVQNVGQNYDEINKTGEGTLDLKGYNGNEFIYVDLKTNYRDYSRYMSILESIEKEPIKIGVKNNNDVDVVAENNGSAPVVKGKVVFKKDNIYLSEKIISEIDSVGNNQNPGDCPAIYPLYLKLTQNEYRKLKADTKYEIFLNGNQNIFTFQVAKNFKLEKEMIFNRPLSFVTKGPTIKIEPGILDFGKIKPKQHKEPLIIKSAETEIKVIIEDGLAKEFTTVLEPEMDEIWIHEKNGAGEVIQNGEKLKVRSITVKSKTQNGVTSTGKRQDDFIISGILEVPNKTNPKRAEYGGHVTVNFTYY